jgi:hypothetical protein
LISEEKYEQILDCLPSETTISNKTTRPAASSQSQAPTNAFSNLSINNDAPPAYNNPTPPSLPSRQAAEPPKPEISRATALYRYSDPKGEDCDFEVGDEIAVYNKLNADWWHGRNTRTGKEGMFPNTYVQERAPPSNAYTGNEKQNYAGYQQGPPPPGPSNPYNSAVPPMQMANEPTEQKPGKGSEMGKKFGKKLGNAAIFGAGATIGGKIVNGIF